MKNAKFTKIAATLGALLVAGAACATDSGTGQLGVSATIAPECAVAQNAAIDFGTLSMLDSVNATQSTADSVHAGSMNAICTNGTTLPKFKYTSLNGAGAFQMIGDDGTAMIPYTLHQDNSASLTAVTSDTLVAHPGFTVDGTTKALDISARVIPAGKAGKPMQGYTDTITVTTSFGV